MRIATPLFAFGKNADIGHWFAMTKTDFVYSLRRPGESRGASCVCWQATRFVPPPAGEDVGAADR